MNKRELSLMMRASLGSFKAKQDLVEQFEKKIRKNYIVSLILIGIGFYLFSLSALFWFIVIFSVGNDIYLRKQLKRISAIETNMNLKDDGYYEKYIQAP